MKFRSAKEIKEYLAPIAASQGLTVREVTVKNNRNPQITVFIDRDGGVDLDACEKFHRAIDEPMDELDPSYGEPYTLNVSSAGIDRPFDCDEDFIRSLGGEVEVTLRSPIKGKKYYEGVLSFFDGRTLRVRVSEKETLTFDRKSVAKINKAIKFE